MVSKACLRHGGIAPLTGFNRALSQRRNRACDTFAPFAVHLVRHSKTFSP